MTLFDEGVKKIWKEDSASQIHFLEVLKTIRYADVDYLKSLGVFFVPNQDYLYKYFGKDSLSLSMDFYSGDGTCKWLGTYMIPIRGVNKEIVGFTGFNPASNLIYMDNEINGTDLEIPVKYIISSKTVFDRLNYFLCPMGIMNAIKDEYIVIVDGVFDSLTLASNGINVAALLGSDVSEQLLYQLSFVKNIFVANDNDDAGLRLLNIIQTRFSKAVQIKQSKTKDLDEFITKYGPRDLKYKIMNSMNSRIKLPIIL